MSWELALNEYQLRDSNSDRDTSQLCSVTDQCSAVDAVQDSFRKHDIVIMMGDLNTKVCPDSTYDGENYPGNLELPSTLTASSQEA